MFGLMDVFRTILIYFVGLHNCSGYDNLSLNRTADQYLIWACTGAQCNPYKAENVIDGNTGTCSRTRVITPSGPDHLTWWRLDLGNILSINSVRIQFKDFGEEYAQRQRGRFAGFSLYVSNTTTLEDAFLCYKNGYELPPLDFTIPCQKLGKFVIYYNERLANIEYPNNYELNSYGELCEITVEGCKRKGVFGRNCSLQCPRHCQDQRCDIVNGSCLGCKPGWIGEFCSHSCSIGFYGIGCNETCSWHCANNSTCNTVNGYCENGCMAGWEGLKCDRACGSGKYGVNCVFNCSENCLLDLFCNRFSGECERGCIPGYTGVRCDKECSYGTYGQNCMKKCSTYCKDGGCDHVTGFCNSECKAGYQGHKCDKVCGFGRYGSNCSKECSSNCVNQSCEHENGTCKYGCLPGWRHNRCSEECSPLTYGKNCVQKCSSHCANSETCNHVTGICVKGCANGYIGSLCNSSCVKGYFGRNCTHKCSENCTAPCNHVTGMCYCLPGLTDNPYCRKVSNSVQTCKTNEQTVALIISGGLNALLICTVAFLIRIVYIKKKCEARTKLKVAETCHNKEETEPQYQDIGPMDQSLCYQELNTRDKKSFYQNFY